jgi:magnesium transporter
MNGCQLYTYNSEDFILKIESAQYFSNNFPESQTEFDSTSWLNFHSLVQKKSITSLCNKLGIEKLCIDSIFMPTKRAKVEEYPSYMFFSIKAVLSEVGEKDSVVSEQISFILGHDYIVTFQEKPEDHFDSVRSRIESGTDVIRTKPSDFLLFRLLECIVDNFYNVVDGINEDILSLENQISIGESEFLRKVELEKRKLNQLKKIVIPMRDITIQLESAETPFIHDRNGHHFSNLKFLCESVLEEIESSKQSLDGLSNIYYANQGQRMNQIMKILTVISSIFIPLTFIAGVYGMNFENMPELKLRWGYFLIMSLMLSIGVGLFVYFFKKGWFK